MVSYVIVMLLPIVALYSLYITISHYDEEQDLKEYMEKTNRMVEWEDRLQNSSLYQIQKPANYQSIKDETDNTIQITLYRHDGILLYSTIDGATPTRFLRENLDQLYKDLNDVKKNHRTYSLKKPVFEDGSLIGFYQITISREEWLNELEHRSWLTGVIFIAFLIILYISVVYLLHRKLRTPLKLLRRQMTDFADNRQVEPNSYLANDEVGEVIRHFHNMKQQIESTRQALQKQQEEKEYMVAALTHDLKTPLTVIQAYTEVLQNQNNLTLKEKQEYQAILLNKLTYMKHLLNDLAIYTSLQSSSKPFEMVKVDGEEFFDMLLSGYDQSCANQQISLYTEACTKDTYTLNVEQLTRVVDNLMSNSLRYTEVGGKIWLAAIASNCPLPDWIFPNIANELDSWRIGGTIIIIQNEGKVIPLEQQNRIFQPFVQMEDSRGNSGSSGLGLSIAKKIIEQHEGKIHLWSIKEFGTTVVCWIKEKETI